MSNPGEAAYQCISFIGTSATLPRPERRSRLSASTSGHIRCSPLHTEGVGEGWWGGAEIKCLGIKLESFARRLNKHEQPEKPRGFK